jgi:hydrogenase maturation protease
MPLVILGLGNLLLTDDGVGVHALRALDADPPHGTLLREIGTSVFDALPYLESAARVIAVDAIDAARPPGSVVSFELDTGDTTPPPSSLHDLDLPALLRSLPPERRASVTVVGIQPAVIAPGMDLSPLVRDALPLLLATVHRLAAECAQPDM